MLWLTGSDKGNWLREADVSFLIGKGPSEAESDASLSNEEADTVKVRYCGGASHPENLALAMNVTALHYTSEDLEKQDLCCRGAYCWG